MGKYKRRWEHRNGMKKFVAALVLVKLAFIVSFLTLAVTSCQSSSSQTVEVSATPSPSPEANDNIERPTSEPYTGDLLIFEGAERAKNLQIDRVMDILKISDKKTVADIGAGSGWFTVRAAKRVGTGGQVFAVEINQEYIDHINARAKTENLTNIKTILGKPNDPVLPPNSVDSVLILKTYHEIAEPIRLLRNLKAALKKDALLGIIDRNGNGDDHGLDKETVIKEAALAGYILKEQYDFVKPDGMDYFLVFGQ